VIKSFGFKKKNKVIVNSHIIMRFQLFKITNFHSTNIQYLPKNTHNDEETDNQNN
jgi:hypothetical protein